MLRLRERAHQRLFICRQGRIAVLGEELGIDLDLACRRGESFRRSVLRFGVLAMAGLDRHANAAGILAELLERHA